MDEHYISMVTKEMEPHLSASQLQLLARVMHSVHREDLAHVDPISFFLAAKEAEGCSCKTIQYYRQTLESLASSIGDDLLRINTNTLRKYLMDYERNRAVSKATIDNIRRIISSFYTWLEDEDYIVKSPARRIKHVKTPKKVKTTFSDEDLELLRGRCDNSRDLVIIDMLASTGMRIGELVGLNVEDINLDERECLVTGKGNKQRLVYFDARTKVHLRDYLDERADNQAALFTPLKGPARRLTIGAVELRLRRMGESLNLQRVHPHKFRRTLATNAIDKGMPIEQVQKLLGHEKIDTTMHYALVNQSNVKASHRKYLE